MNSEEILTASRRENVLTGFHGTYRLEARHGEGSFGVTYRARNASTGAPVIVKELRIERLDDWKALELFEREGRVLASLSHPNIPAFRDFFAYGAPTPLPVSAMSTYAGPERLSLVLVQELIEGVTLQQRIDHGRRLSPDEAEGILDALLQALRHLHERNPPLVHRDIKPGNVILTPDGRPYLVDFGAIQDRLRSTGSVGSTIVGTLGYMPVEQTRGQARPASDLYALGLTIIVGLAGQAVEQLPVDESTGKIAVARAVPRETPPFLRDALDSMVALLVNQRVQSAAEVLSRLDMGRRGAPAGIPGERRETPLALAPAPPFQRPHEAPLPRASKASREDREWERVATLRQPTAEHLQAPVAPAGRVFARSADQSPVSLSANDIPMQRLVGLRVALAVCAVVGLLSGVVAYVKLRHPRGPSNPNNALAVPGANATRQRLADGCRLGRGSDCYALATDYDSDRSDRDMPRAADAYRLACDRGDSRGCAGLGAMAANGWGGVKKDRARAAGLFTQACDKGVELGCRNLGAMEALGRSATKGEPLAIQGNSAVQALLVDTCWTLGGQECFALGSAYEVGVPPDLPRAADAYRWACNSRSGAKGCSALGDMYARGRGVAKDDKAATDSYSSGCAYGDARACVRVGAAYASGAGLPGWKKEDRRARAVTYYKQACDGGAPEGCALQGELYENGIGVEANMARAVAFYRQACDAGDPLGCDDLGRMYVERRGVSDDVGHAVAIFTSGCDGGNSGSCTSLGLMYEKGAGVRMDASRAFTLYGQACDRGHARGCTRLGATYEKGAGVKKNAFHAASFYAQACDGGDSVGCRDLGVLYETGAGVQKAASRAVALYEQACDAGDGNGCSRLAEKCEKGIGVAVDRARAVDLYREGCKEGDSWGCAQLKRLGEST
jgi:TPR repeat protein